MADPTDSSEGSRADKLRRIRELGLDPWGGRFDGHRPIAGVCAAAQDVPPGTTTEERTRIAGRLVGRRDQGKVYFLDLWDWTGRVQVYVGRKQVGEQGWALAELLDFGDLLGVDGRIGRTRAGEITVFADRLTYLAKSLDPHPDKFHGMQDVEFRLRHRYLDLVYNPEVLDRASKRVRIVRRIRRHLDDLGYLEVETPTLHAIAGGAAARPFVTHHNALDIDLYLRIALELHLKRLLVGGIEQVYEIGRVFRNEGISPRHNPEFTMLELYQAYGNYETMMDLTEGLVVACVREVSDGLSITFGDKQVDFTPPWRRARYADLFAEHVGVPMDDATGAARRAEQLGFGTAGKDPDVVVHFLFEELVEDKLTGPVFVYDYPAALCPLTKRKAGDPRVAERFELYVEGMELANAYTELNDPETQEATFRQQLAGLSEDESMARMDEDFVRALRHGMPPAGGLGVGIDRLVMVLTDTRSIRDVILFPLLRPEKA